MLKVATLMGSVPMNADDEPSWFDPKNHKVDEVEFCRWFMAKHPIKSVGGQFYDIDGLVCNEKLAKEQIAEKLATSIANRQQLLKLLAMNNYDMEANSRPELLTSFKVAYGESMKNVCMILTKFCPEKSVQEIQDFIYVFFPFMFGIYPYAEVTEKQKKAMKEAEVDYMYQSIYEITYRCLLKLFGIG